MLMLGILSTSSFLRSFYVLILLPLDSCIILPLVSWIILLDSCNLLILIFDSLLAYESFIYDSSVSSSASLYRFFLVYLFTKILSRF